MNASEVAAWAGATGAIANAVALVAVERRKRKSEAELTAYFNGLSGAGEREDDYGNPVAAVVEATLHVNAPTLVVAAGIVREGFPQRFRSPLQPRIVGARVMGQSLSGGGRSLPVSCGDSPWIHLSIVVGELLAEVGTERRYRAWVKLGNGQRICSIESFTLAPTSGERSPK